jgi:hypothetical protein
MRWSKSRKALRELLSESVKRRVQFHVTQYGPGQSYTMARAWITWDGQEIANFSSVEWLMKSQQLAQQIREANRVADFINLAQQNRYYQSYAQATAILQKQGIFSRDQFQDAVEGYLNLSIDVALISGNPIIKALSMFDRRLGRRRLTNLQLEDTDHALVRQFYHLRCQAEEIPEVH